MKPIKHVVAFGEELPVYASGDFDNRADAIAASFPAETTRKIMELMNWRWAHTVDSSQPPTVSEIRAAVKKHVLWVLRSGSVFGRSSGGLAIKKHASGEIEVLFVPCQVHEQTNETDGGFVVVPPVGVK